MHGCPMSAEVLIVTVSADSKSTCISVPAAQLSTGEQSAGACSSGRVTACAHPVGDWDGNRTQCKRLHSSAPGVIADSVKTVCKGVCL